MWLNSDGIVNTVALPDPEEVLSPDFTLSLRNLIEKDREGLEDLLSKLEEELFESAGAFDETIEAGFRGVAPSGVLLAGTPNSLAALRSLLDQVEARWRLDATMAVQDLVDLVD